MQTSKMEGFTTIVNSLKPSTTVAELSLLDIYGGAGYAVDMRSDLVCGRRAGVNDTDCRHFLLRQWFLSIISFLDFIKK